MKFRKNIEKILPVPPYSIGTVPTQNKFTDLQLQISVPSKYINSQIYSYRFQPLLSISIHRSAVTDFSLPLVYKFTDLQLQISVPTRYINSQIHSYRFQSPLSISIHRSAVTDLEEVMEQSERITEVFCAANRRERQNAGESNGFPRVDIAATTASNLFLV